MRLLVSVSNADDARAALLGGADIVDAKDPARGGLAAVPAAVLEEIVRTARARRPVSAALGDAADERAIERAAREAAAQSLAFVKLGFAGVADARRAAALAAAAVHGAREADTGTTVVLVAYADHLRAGAPSPREMVGVAEQSGAEGVLLDTAFKGGGGLFDLLSADDVARWLRDACVACLHTALAGGLDDDGVRRARALGAQVAGVRAAVCEGGRTGAVSAARVATLVALAHGRAHVAQQVAQMPDVARPEHDRLHAAG